MDGGDGSAGRLALQYGALAVTWGASFLLIKIGLEGLSPGQVVLGRLLTGAVMLAVVSAARRSRLPRDPAVWAHLAVVGVLLCDVPFLLFAWAEQHIPSSLASIYNAATPLMTALWGLAVLPGERPTRAGLAGLITGFAGVVLVLSPWHLASRSQSLAQLACLGATACYGAGFTYLRRFISPRGISALTTATLQVGIAAVVALVLVPWTAAVPVRLSPAVTGSVLALGALGTGIAYVWNTSIVASWGATVVSTVTYVIPVVGVALGAVVLSETLTWNEPAGAAIVILGLLTAQNRLAPVARHIRVRSRTPPIVLPEETRKMRGPGGPAGELARSPVDVLQASGVAFSVREHFPVIGQADAERELGLPADQMLKTMVFRAGERTVLAVLPAHSRVHYGKLARAAGVQRSMLRQAGPDDLARIGMMPGGASPVCGVDGVITVFDVSASEMGIVFCGSGRTDRTVEIEAKTLVGFVRPVIAAVAADRQG